MTSEHIVAPKTYYLVFALLLGLLMLTVWAAQIPHPLLNIVLAISIATIKAVLIVLYFMHVRYSASLLRVVVLAGFVWLLLLIGLTMSDYSTRKWDRRELGQVNGLVDTAFQVPLRSEKRD